MLEFYPLPTNLNHGTSLYGQQQNLGGARFLDNPTTTNNNNNNNNNITAACCSLLMPAAISQQQQQQQQQQQMQIASPNQAACPPQQASSTSALTKCCSTAALTVHIPLNIQLQQQQQQQQQQQNNNNNSSSSDGDAGDYAEVDNDVGHDKNNNNKSNCSTILPLPQSLRNNATSDLTATLNFSGLLGNDNNNNNNSNNNNNIKCQINNMTHNSIYNNINNNKTSNNNNFNENKQNILNKLNNTPSTIIAATTATIAATIATTTTVGRATTTIAANAITSITATASSTSTVATAVTTVATPAATAAPGTTKIKSSALTATAAAAAATTAATTTTMCLNECKGHSEVADQIKCERNCEICEGCGRKIHDRFFMNVGDTNWHENCLACCFCGLQLYRTCYVRNGKLYCKMDYDRLFGYKCAACCLPILPHDMVMRPLNNLIFHLACFVCVACRLPLLKGEQFMLREGQILCFRHDLESEFYFATAAAAHHCGFLGLDEDDLMMRPRDGRRGPKRPRTILTSQQRKQFKLSFEQSPKPCRKVREALAKDTGLSVRVVQVWFQNQRAKMKKIQRKAKINNINNNNKDKDKLEKDENKYDSNSSIVGGGDHSENNYLSLDSNFASQPLNPNMPFSPDDYQNNSNDSFCSSDLSLDGSNFDHLDDDTDSLSLNNLELQSTGSSGHHHNRNNYHQHSTGHDILANLNNPLTNPIDKLYLMQNSYFQGDT